MKPLFALLLCTLFFLSCSPDSDFIDNGSKNTGGTTVMTEISSESDLITFRTANKNYAGLTIKLTKDITLSREWIPIGEFAGTFDGQGYTIRNLSISGRKCEQGLFKLNKGTIRNLKVSGQIMADQYVGGICARNEGKLENCTFSGGIDGGDQVGGICAYNTGEISWCVNEATLKGINNVGGICGTSYGKSQYNTISVSSCLNKGDVNGEYYVGGIAGYGSFSLLQNCENSKPISGINSIGGISGYGIRGLKVSDCTNLGAITATSDDSGYGGILGTFSGDRIETCSNAAPITGGRMYTGGIVGFNKGIIDNCHNTGRISLLVKEGTSSTGGICGSNSGGTIRDTSNSGEVEGSKTATGGISGSNYGKAWILNCFNEGKVTATDGTQVAGVCGYSSGSESVIAACYNDADIAGRNQIGGISGYNSGSVIASYNKRAVTGSREETGGVAGYNSGWVKACYNVGAVSSEAPSYIGSICGRNANGANAVQSCYYKTGTWKGGIDSEDTPGRTSAFVHTEYALQVETDAMNKVIDSALIPYKYKPISEGFPVLTK